MQVQRFKESNAILQFPLPSICIPINRLYSPKHKKGERASLGVGGIDKKDIYARSLNFIYVVRPIYNFFKLRIILLVNKKTANSIQKTTEFLFSGEREKQ
jgi:hypothetical protein